MKQTAVPANSITATSILSGLGSLDREEICSFLVILEEIGAVSLAKGALEDVGKRMKIIDNVTAKGMDAAKQRLIDSPETDAILRHRLWVRLADALVVPTTVPLSSRSARRAATALAVRASERLTPSVLTQSKKAETAIAGEGPSAITGKRAADIWNAGRQLIARRDPLSFPDLVRKELLNMLANEGLVFTAAVQADPEIAEALHKAHGAAQKAIATGGGWVAFAAIVGNTGFLPYILAAQLSAWVPMVGGPALVSLLATLTNPLTVIAGVGALGWLAVGKGSSVVRSQVAARICVLLALPRSKSLESGIEVFLMDMRSLDREPSAAFGHLSKKDRHALRGRLSFLSGRLLSAIPPPAGLPPSPWHQMPRNHDITGAGLVASLTAGEMLWHATALDENVLKAADFSRSADLSDPLSFAASSQTFLLKGAGYSLRGYTAEQLVLDQLVAEGHDVSLAEASNTPGLDLIVDGSPVQVKCGSELSNLVEHFEKYPDIPVIANKELAEKAAKSGKDWADMVTTLPGFDISTIEQQLAEALNHAVDLADPDIMELALSLGLLRGGVEVMQGKIPARDLPSWLLLDGASRGTLSFVGAKAGGWLGLVMIGPAGALVLGPAIGCAALVGNSTLKNKAQQILMREWIHELLDRGSDLHKAISAALERRVRHLLDRTTNLQSVSLEDHKIATWMVSRSQDDLVAAIEDMAELGQNPTREEHCVELLFMASDIAPTDASVLRSAGRLNKHFMMKPALQELLVDQQIRTARNAFDKHLRALFGSS
ncbi:MAG TPA: hypothetical protein DIT67_01785 [Octadecabacter sp.]|nr:hypothetical protein [Octadecabacter sp.]